MPPSGLFRRAGGWPPLSGWGLFPPVAADRSIMPAERLHQLLLLVLHLDGVIDLRSSNNTYHQLVPL